MLEIEVVLASFPNLTERFPFLFSPVNKLTSQNLMKLSTTIDLSVSVIWPVKRTPSCLRVSFFLEGSLFMCWKMPSSTLCEGCTSKFSLITKLPNSLGADPTADAEEQLAPLKPLKPPNSQCSSEEVFELEALRWELGKASNSNDDSFELEAFEPFEVLVMCCNCNSKIVCFES